MKILGIETSCDETAVGIVQNSGKMLSNVVYSSMDLHAVFGGVIPEIAARSHIEAILPAIEESLRVAKTSWDEIDAIAVTYGAGLGGSLLVGVSTAKALSLALNKPLYAANHVLGHVYANFITDSDLAGYSFSFDVPRFPFLAIIVSGGHSQLVLFKDHFKYVLLGKTQDDAIGEAFDKVAKILGLGYPGGPMVSEIAKKGNPKEFKLPIANMPGYDFSFSGLKTAVLRLSQNLIGENYTFPSTKLSERLNMSQKANIAASFQYIAIKTILQKARRAANEYAIRDIVIAGGVAANLELRRQLAEVFGDKLIFPDTKLCTDNGAMIAILGSFMVENGQGRVDPKTLDISPNLTI